jgi:hypothetical protein
MSTATISGQDSPGVQSRRRVSPLSDVALLNALFGLGFGIGFLNDVSAQRGETLLHLRMDELQTRKAELIADGSPIFHLTY